MILTHEQKVNTSEISDNIKVYLVYLHTNKKDGNRVQQMALEGWLNSTRLLAGR